MTEVASRSHVSTCPPLKEAAFGRCYFYGITYYIEQPVLTLENSINADDHGDVVAPLISRTSYPDNFLYVVVVDAERNFADSAVVSRASSSGWALKKRAELQFTAITLYLGGSWRKVIVHAFPWSGCVRPRIFKQITARGGHDRSIFQAFHRTTFINIVDFIAEYPRAIGGTRAFNQNGRTLIKYWDELE